MKWLFLSLKLIVIINSVGIVLAMVTYFLQNLSFERGSPFVIPVFCLWEIFFLVNKGFPLFMKFHQPEALFLFADQNIENLVMHSVLSFIALVDVRYITESLRALAVEIYVHYSYKNFLFASPHTYNLHQELLNFMLVAMSTQLLSVPSLGPKDVHPFIDAAMTEVTI